MSVIIKPEHTSGVVELSSDDDETVPILSTINSGIPITEASERSSTPDSQCSICLDDVKNKCHTNTCWHKFCFECLQKWSNSEPTCPLCKKSFKYIYHSFGDGDVRKTYDVPVTRIPSPTVWIRPLGEMSEDLDSMFRMNLFLDIFRGHDDSVMRYDENGMDLNHNGYNEFLSDPYTNYPRPTLHRPIIGQGFRIQVYAENIWADRLPDTTGRFRECSSAFYRDNPAQTYRLHSFILRDLVAVRESLRLEGQQMPFPVDTDVALTNMIMRSLAVYEIRQLHTLNILMPFLNAHAFHFCHELYNFANSPYDLSGYDRNVQYTSPPPDEETIQAMFANVLPDIHILGDTIVLDSDNEEVVRPHAMEVIEVSSSTDDSDVEILSHSFLSIDPRNSASINQPSTSTGIRDSLDRPNNRYNLRRRRIFSPTINDSPNYQSVYGDLSRMPYPSQGRRGRPILDSSSDDEELITGHRGSQTALRKSRNVNEKRKKKTKKNKNKKRKINTNDSRSEIRSTIRSRSYSGSSSSSEETDIRPINSDILQM